MTGGRLDDISAACDEATSNNDNNTVLIIHADTNDVMNTRSEELLENYRWMIQQYNCKYNKILLQNSAPTVSYNRASVLTAVISPFVQGKV